MGIIKQEYPARYCEITPYVLIGVSILPVNSATRALIRASRDSIAS